MQPYKFDKPDRLELALTRRMYKVRVVKKSISVRMVKGIGRSLDSRALRGDFLSVVG
jgi:uncharacterized protein